MFIVSRAYSHPLQPLYVVCVCAYVYFNHIPLHRTICERLANLSHKSSTLDVYTSHSRKFLRCLYLYRIEFKIMNTPHSRPTFTFVFSFAFLLLFRFDFVQFSRMKAFSVIYLQIGLANFSTFIDLISHQWHSAKKYTSPGFDCRLIPSQRFVSYVNNKWNSALCSVFLVDLYS